MTANHSFRRPPLSGIITALFFVALFAVFGAVLLMTGCTAGAPASSAVPGAAARVSVTVATDAALAAFPKATPYVATITAAIRSVASVQPLTPAQLQAAVNQWVTPLAGAIPGLPQVAAAVVTDYQKTYPRIVAAADKIAALEAYVAVVEEAAK